jgi:hypothetical protein
MFNNLFSENRAVCDIMWKTIVEPDRPHDNMTHARSRNRYCRGKAGNITFEECVCMCVCVPLDLVMQHAMHMRRIIRDLSDYYNFPHYLINGTIFLKRLSSIYCVF